MKSMIAALRRQAMIGGSPGSGDGTTIKNQDKTITENGQYSADSGYTGLGTVTVAVPEEEPKLQDKEVTANGAYTADAGYDGLGEVVVNVEAAAAEPVISPLEVTENGTYEAPEGVDGYSPVTVNVAGGEGSVDYFVALLTGQTFSYSNDEIQTVVGNACSYCKTLTSVNLPNASDVGDSAFSGCAALVSVRLDSVTQLTNRVFSSCTSLTDVYVPLLEKMYNYTFYNDTALKKLDLPNLKSLGTYALSGCTALRTLILRRAEGICELTGATALKKTPFYEGDVGGKLLVPSALVTTYQEATNWSTIYSYGTSKFLALEDYTVDGTTTGEIDWDKLNALDEETSA